MAHVDLDVVLRPGECTSDAVYSVTKGVNAIGEVIEESGAGGGWPVVRFTGPRDDLIKPIAQYSRVHPRGPLGPEERAQAAYLETLIQD